MPCCVAGRLSVLCFLIALPLSASGQTFDNVVVGGQANVFAAGRASTASVGGGILPPGVAIAPGVNRVLQFSSVTGTVSIAGAAPPNGPDGSATETTNIDSTLGVSGIVHSNRGMFLVGVFLAGTEPVNPSPSRLSFTDPEDFLTLSPLLYQTFFVGDGLTDTGLQTQTFLVPDSATRFFMGFADGFSVQGPPGAYFDNSGQLLASFSITSVPEPSTLALGLAVLGGGGVAALRRRRMAEAG